MALTVYLYAISCDPRLIDKSAYLKSPVITDAYVLKNTTDSVNPQISSDFGSSYPFPRGVNYVYIKNFGKYYFLRGQVADRSIRWYQLHCDVLMTYKTEILKSKVWAIKSSNKGNWLLPDSLPIWANKNIQYRKFSNDGTGDYISAYGSDKIGVDSRSVLLTCI